MENPDIKYEKFIDIREVFQKKNSTLLNILPRFVIQYLRRIIHEEDLNAFFLRNKGNSGIVHVGNILEEFGTSIKARGQENIPKKGRAVVASNHPFGGLDGLVLMKTTAEVRPDIKIPANDILMNLPSSEEMFIPINKHGSNADNVKVFNENFASDALMLFFPAGLVSRKRKGVISDLEWKKTFISKAKQHKRDIIPTHMDGRNSNFFYNIANLREKLGVKSNFEMLYLVNEMYKQQGKTIHITFGKPIPYQTFDKRMTYAKWAEKVKEHVYILENNPDAIFNY